MSRDRYTDEDWDYAVCAEGNEGDEDYESDAYVHVTCLVTGCVWSSDGDWQPDGPEGIYRPHWREKHAGSDDSVPTTS